MKELVRSAPWIGPARAWMSQKMVWWGRTVGLQMRLPIPHKKNAIPSLALAACIIRLQVMTQKRGTTYPISDWSSAMDEKNGPNSATSEISNDQSAPPYTLAARRSSAYMLP